MRPPTGHVGTILLGGDQRLFETGLLSEEECPHRTVVALETTLSEVSLPASRSGKILPDRHQLIAVWPPAIFFGLKAQNWTRRSVPGM